MTAISHYWNISNEIGANRVCNHITEIIEKQRRLCFGSDLFAIRSSDAKDVWCCIGVTSRSRQRIIYGLFYFEKVNVWPHVISLLHPLHWWCFSSLTGPSDCALDSARVYVWTVHHRKMVKKYFFCMAVTFSNEYVWPRRAMYVYISAFVCTFKWLICIMGAWHHCYSQYSYIACIEFCNEKSYGTPKERWNVCFGVRYALQHEHQ